MAAALLSFALTLAAGAHAAYAGATDTPASTTEAEARELVPPAPSAYLGRGLAMLERPRPEDQAEARRLLLKALAADPGLSAAHAGLARSALYVHAIGIDPSPRRLADALAEARLAVDTGSASAEHVATYALALAASDRLTEARAEALKARALGGDGPEADLALCIIDRLRRALDDAVAACRRAADRDPDEPRVLVALAEALRESGRYDAAMELFGQAVDLDHESATALLGAAATLAKSGQFNMAGRAYDTVIEKYPFATMRALQGAAGMRISASDWEGALDLYDRVDLPEDGSLPTLLSLYGKGYALLRLDRAAEAEYFLSLLIERVPAGYDGPARGREMLFRAYTDLFTYFDEHRRADRALALLRSATAWPGAPTGLARTLAARLEARGSAREASEVLERAILAAAADEDPLEISESALALARLRSAGGRRAIPERSEAGRALRTAGERVPADAPGPAHYRMARAHGLARQPDQCLAALERARTRGYLPAQAETEQDLASVRALPRFRALFAATPETP
jgi:tetratricopeptide (TPR) repeat protein